MKLTFKDKTLLLVVAVTAPIAWFPYFAGMSKMPWPLVSWVAGPVFVLLLRRLTDSNSKDNGVSHG